MMEVNYIYQSGFKVELDDKILVFDYSYEKLSNLKKSKEIYFFTSSCADDHFSSAIFHLGAERENVHYYVCKDNLLKSKFNGVKFFLNHIVEKKTRSKIIYTEPHRFYDDNGIRVRTFSSCDDNDSVAYLVEANGKTIFHAGHMNIWSWPDRSEAYNNLAKNKFIAEVDKLKKFHIDIAFLIVDPRQESCYADGFDYFMRHTDTDRVYPCHFKNKKKIISFLLKDEISKPYREKIQLTADYLE